MVVSGHRVGIDVDCASAQSGEYQLVYLLPVLKNTGHGRCRSAALSGVEVFAPATMRILM